MADETRWLTPDEQVAWRSFIQGVHALDGALDRQMQSASGMALTYYETMIPLSEAPGRSMRMSELADATRSSRSRLSHAVTRLEQRGWVVREDCETDRRGQVAVLTDAGFEAISAAAPGHAETVRALLVDRLSADELATIRRIGELLLESSATV